MATHASSACEFESLANLCALVLLLGHASSLQIDTAGHAGLTWSFVELESGEDLRSCMSLHVLGALLVCSGPRLGFQYLSLKSSVGAWRGRSIFCHLW